MKERRELRGAPDRDITETILNKVLDAGINYIDTSMDYGLSDERIVLAVTSRIGTLNFIALDATPLASQHQLRSV